MSTVKTAISIDKDLFKKVELLSRDIHLSRSQIFAQAVEYLMEKKENLILLKKINEAYSGPDDKMNSTRAKGAKKKHLKLVKGSW